MKRGLLTLVTAAIAFRTGHLAQRQAPGGTWRKVVNRQASAYPGCESFPRRSEHSNPPPDRVAILTCPLYLPLISSCIRWPWRVFISFNRMYQI